MKEFDEEENENQKRRRVFQLQGPYFQRRKKHFGNIFAQDVSLAELKIDFRKIFVRASSSQNLENSVR